MTAQQFQVLKSATEMDWLLQRQRILTATDMARIMTGGPIVVERVLSEKRNPPQPLAPTRTLDWGHEREPHIISAMNEMAGVNLVHNTSLCVRTDEDRFGGTPDAISIEDEAVGEAKTYSGERFVITDEHYYQCMWNTYILGAKRCFYGWEEHDDFVVRGPVQMEVIERDEAVIDSMIDRAYQVLEQSAVMPTFDDELDRLILEHDVYHQAEAAAKKGKDEIKDAIRSLLGVYSEYGYISDAGSISSSLPKPRKSINAEKLEDLIKTYPDIARKYVTISEQKKPTLTVTRKKQKKN